MVNTSKKWFKEITDTMVTYLRNTASTLSLRGINPINVIIEVICCQIINSNSPGAELLHHGILPVKSPPFIILRPHKVDLNSFKINTELESYIIRSIEKYLELSNKETLTDIYVTHIIQCLGSKQAIGSELDATFASAIIEKRGCSVLEELKRWTGNTNGSDFIFPEWITPGMQFVTEINLSNNILLYDYIKDIYKSTRYHNAAIQLAIHAGSDLVLLLVDESNESKNVVLLSLSSAFYKDAVPADKIRMQAFKVCMEFQYMIKNEEKKEMIKRKRVINKSGSNKSGPNKSEPENKKMKMDYCESGVSDDIGLTENFWKEMKNLKYCLVSKIPEHAKLHHEIAKLMTANNISSNAADKRKCIHVLVELPHRALSKRPDILHIDKKEICVDPNYSTKNTDFQNFVKLSDFLNNYIEKG
ncbi:hypothetical protein C1646_800762 [Rhizophagus diaphanus]|nr:hypothetical protein C1646_800762 [Rhizophagus diaphanus] [Rhizophagus sp. MUCL 43196]